MIVGAGVFFESCKAGGMAVQPGNLNQEAEGPGGTEEAGIPVLEPDDTEEALTKPAVLVLNMEEEPDIILEAYRDPACRDEVVDFFRELCGSLDVATVVLSNAAVFDIPPALAFSLCAEESNYNPQALNRNRNETIDRGLFQLNSATFPDLEVVDFYNPGINAWHGLSHLRWCLDAGGTEVAALAMYNAGSTRVRSAGTPKNTLDYISRILKRQRKIEALFMAEYTSVAAAEKIETAKGKNTSFRLSLLTPLGGR